ncbi:hypothetical protein [Paenibacillus beijingensis]|uniref:Uncharacterized protein n=1 Tax=Paenibacillus beijingensis TaxID=1126833 RepID=A0A0D5NPU8_9BACL|nr:hypothetical protein [Paenibacillus beijingensis]AJY77175.1 hypothetical protein VN24_24755 [Paenibacillus beijingensis]
MSVRIRMLAAWAAALAAVLLLGLLPFKQTDGNGSGAAVREMMVFNPEAEGRMNNRNLVDLLTGLELSQRMTRVGWNNAVLSVDLVVPAEGGYSDDWFRDVNKLVHLAFRQVDNVSRLLVRCSSEFPAGQQAASAPGDAPAAFAEGDLLFSADVRKSDAWLKDKGEEAPPTDPVRNREWRNRLRLHFTSEWDARFGSSSL